MKPIARASSWVLLSALLSVARAVPAENPTPRGLRGPAVVDLASSAHFDLPAGFVFLPAAEARAMLHQLGGRVAGNEAGFVAPASMDWFVLLRMVRPGFVADRDDGDLRPEALLERLRQIEEQANEARRRTGAAPVTLSGWESEPSYDRQNHRLEWAVRARSSAGDLVNQAVCLLGRETAVEFFLVATRRDASTLSAFQSLAGSLQFRPPERYIDHQPTDPVAKGGLASLLTGPPVREIEAGSPHAAEPARFPPWAVAYLVIAALAGGALAGIAAQKLGRKWLERRGWRPPDPAAQENEAVPPPQPVDPDQYYQNLTRDLYRGR